MDRGHHQGEVARVRLVAARVFDPGQVERAAARELLRLRHHWRAVGAFGGHRRGLEHHAERFLFGQCMRKAGQKTED